MANFRDITDRLKKANHYEKLIKMLDNKDYYKIASATYVLCNTILKFPIVKKSEPKSARFSDLYRTMGNKQFFNKDYASALQLYNLAILNAPLDSDSFILAVGNRSALFCKIKKFSAALKDIDTCLAMNCPNELQQKLYKRKEDSEALMWQEDVEHNNEFGELSDLKASEDFYKVKGKRNPKFPFAKNSINIVIKDGIDVVVAQADIKIGDIVAVETSYINCNMPDNSYLFCNYCNKYTDNLIPCPTCAGVLYCDEACKKQSWEECHDIECSMAEIMDLLPTWYENRLKFVLKTWNACKDLQQFTKISDKIDKLMQEQGDCKLEFNNVESYLLPPQKDRIKRYGELYDAAIFTALVIHGLTKVPASVLKTLKKHVLITNIAKQVMYHVMHTPFFMTSGAHLELDKDEVISNNVESMGFYPFISRIEHSCNPNVLMVGLANKIALVCKAPIKAGSELSIAYGGDFYNNTKKERQFTCYNLYGFLCNCLPCNEDWQSGSKDDLKGASTVMHKFKWTKDIKVKFDMICDGLAQHSNDPRSKDYKINYEFFRQFLSLYQYGVTRQRFVGSATELQIKGVLNCLR